MGKQTNLQQFGGNHQQTWTDLSSEGINPISWAINPTTMVSVSTEVSGIQNPSSGTMDLTESKECSKHLDGPEKNWKLAIHPKIAM